MLKIAVFKNAKILEIFSKILEKEIYAKANLN